MKLELNPTKEQLVTGNDSIVIRKFIAGIHGGRTLDCTGFTADKISAGHVIIKLQNGNYAPMPVTGNAYSTLPEGASYVGVLVSTIPTKVPAAAIMHHGVVNSAVVPFPMTAIATAFKAACPLITFEQDEEA